MDIHLNRKHKGQLDIFFVLLLFSLAVSAVFVSFQYKREKDFKAESLNAQLQIVNREILSALRTGASPEECVAGLAAKDSLRVTVIDTLGNVIYDTYSDRPDTLSNHALREEVSIAMKEGQAHTQMRLSETGNVSFFYSATSDGNLVVRSAIPYNIDLRQFLEVDSQFVHFVLIVTLLMCLVSFVIARLIDRSVTDKGEREKQDLKRELTDNINHELKTPVSAIKAYLETIITVPDINKATVLNFASKAYEQTERLNKLLQDISTITRLDEAGWMFKHEPVRLKGIIDDIKEYIDVLPEEKRMRLHTNITEDTVVTGDPTLLYSIFRNLSENSLAYSSGTDIYIDIVSEDKAKMEISFADNGVGIDEEHLEKIFYRFYRVDKGRSRKVGGTGLGLAIVKNAVLYHKGTIKARPRRGGGLEFIFTLSK